MTADISLEGIDLGREGDFSLGPLRVSPSAREVELGGRTQMLEPRVMQALVALARRQGEVVSREALTETCWDGRIVGDDAINRVMGKLRRLGMETGAFVLETIPRVGYRLILAQEQAAPQAPARPWPKRWLAVAVAIVFVALAGWMAWRIWASPLTPDTPVAVLPFTVSGSDPAAAAFAAAAHREVAGIMTDNKVPMIAADKSGRRLEIKGEARTEQGRLHARVQLIDPRANVTLWTRDFVAASADPASLSYEIGWRLTSVIQIARNGLEYRTPDFDAKALGYFVQGQDEIVQGSWNMISPVTALVRRAPRYPAGHAGQMSSFLARAGSASPEEARELRAQAQAELVRLKTMAPSSPWPLSQALFTEPSRWAERERLVREGWARLRGDPLPNQELGRLLISAGRVRDGMQLLSQTPASHRAQPGIGGALVYGLNLLGQKEDAVASGERFRAMRPSDAALKRAILMVAFSQGDYAKAEAILADPARRPPGLPTVGLQAFRAAAKAGRTGAAADREDAVQRLAANGQAVPMALASTIPLLSGLGALDEAFAGADTYAARVAGLKQSLGYDPNFFFAPETGAMRADPRFIPLADKLGLLDYWRSTGKWPDFCETEPASVCAAMKAGG